MTASPGDGEHAAREGYYPDPSIPGYVRFWNGLNWVPGTSRPAAPADETGPVFLDQTGVSEALREPERWPRPEPAPRPAADSWPEPAAPRPQPAPRAESGAWPEPAPRQEPEPWPEPAARAETGRGEQPGADPEPAGWQVDPLHQAGFGGPRDHRVSWGHEEAAAARPGGISLARPPVPAPAQAPASSPAPAAVPAPAGVSAALPAQASASAAPGGLGILSAPSPVPAAPAPAPAAAPDPVWPAAPGAPGSDPEPVGRVRPARRPAPAPAPAAAAEPARRPAPVEPADRAERAEAAAAPAPRPARTGRAVFERMAERAVRPAGLVRRATARLLDSLVYAAVATGVALPLVPAATAHLQAKVDAARAGGRTTTVWLLDGTIAGSLGLVLGAVLLFGVFYEALPTARWGRTPGKKLLGVRVLATATLRPPRFGAALRRWLVYAFLGLPGALWALGDRQRRRTLHDRAARTYVAR
ncbi:RDD family protein [Streptomyces sp. NBC_00335]|uniref:RDD family protein n=1 Tax=unclassified Streptomyces TaxID=2593676 RepID=UPI00224CA5AD|nr:MULTISPECIES: RDD family protein [unclassified Streptomyces]MCX5406960.1 RDD family protein [Streptomyces sp. NBC_00086]